MYRILIIEDDNVIGQMLKLYLEGEGFTVCRMETAETGINAIQEFQPEVIILDLILPDSTGNDICGRIRLLTDVPILIVSMKSDVIDRISALQSGADDFLVKPFSMQELKARIESALRRMDSNILKAKDPAPPDKDKPLKFFFDQAKRLLIVDGTSVGLTFSEWELMRLFYSSPGRVFRREELINAVSGFDSFVNNRAIDVHIMNLRKRSNTIRKIPAILRLCGRSDINLLWSNVRFRCGHCLSESAGAFQVLYLTSL